MLTVAEAVDAARAWAGTTSPLAALGASSAWVRVSFDEGPDVEGIPMIYVDRRTCRLHPTTIPEPDLERGMVEV